MERKELSTVLYPVLIIHFEKMNEVEVFFAFTRVGRDD